jgi:hypothetical protein
LKNFTVPMVIEFPLVIGSERATCTNGRGKNESIRFGSLRPFRRAFEAGRVNGKRFV